MTTSRTLRRKTRMPALVCALAMTGALLVACGSGDDEARSASTSADVRAAAAADEHADEHAARHEADKRIALYTAMRSLWGQHMEWTYATVVAFVAQAPNLQATLNRLLRNQGDIGRAVAAYYGDDAGDQLTALLTTHIEQAVPVLTAAKAGDKAALDKAVADWFGNAQDIADFLAGANTNWDRAAMRKMMKGHITQTIAYASDVITGKHAAAIRDYGKAEKHMFEMADMLTYGIIDQFPERF